MEDREAPVEDRALADMQMALVEWLAAGLPAAVVLARLRDDPRCAVHAEWIQAFAPRMVDVASALVRKWTVR